MNFFNKLFALLISLLSVPAAVVAPATEVKLPAPSPEQKTATPTSISREDALKAIKTINAKNFSNWFDPYDVISVMEIESSFRTRAYRYESGLGEASIGLMQILPSSARDRGFYGTEEMLYDVNTNILYGMKHLKWSYDQLRIRLGKAPDKASWIKSYNAGVGGVIKWGGDPLYWNKFSKARAAYP